MSVMEFVSFDNLTVHIFMNFAIQLILCYIIFCATHRLFWMPIKLYVLAQIWSGCALKDHGAWAVVTGATDGIGKGYAQVLAKKGLNVVIISEDDRLPAVKQELMSEYNVEVKTIKADFSNTDVYERIAQEIESLDIGVLVNNVGIAQHIKYFLDVPNKIEFYKDMLAINCLAATEMCAMVLPKMVGKNKGVVVNISSIGKRPSIMTTVYSACKSYISALSEGLRATYCGSGSGIIIQVIEPGMVETGAFKRSMGFQHPSLQTTKRIFAISTESFVASAINTIGWSHACNGHWRHHLADILANLQPDSIMYAYQRSLCEASSKRE